MEENHKSSKKENQDDVGEVICSTTESANTLEEKLGAIEGENGNVEVL